MKILLIRVNGLGNMVMFTPTLVALRKNLPDAKITLLSDNPCAEVIKGSNLVDEFIYLSSRDSIIKKLKGAFILRKKHFDCSIMIFPANHWQSNLFAFFVAAKKRVTHGYDVAKLRTLSFLQNVRVSAVEGIHDVDQNLNLLKVFDIQFSKKDTIFYLSEEDKKFADDFFKKNKLKKVIAVHPGCAKEGATYKRWPIEHFIKAIKLFQEKNYRILLIAGPDEERLIEEINHSLEKKEVLVRNTPIKRVAALAAKCSAFLSTDSGVGHVAAALGVPTLALIGPGDYRRIAPYGKNCAVITNKVRCTPCIRYPFGGSQHTKCTDSQCLKQITPEEVRDKLFSMIEKG